MTTPILWPIDLGLVGPYTETAALGLEFVAPTGTRHTIEGPDTERAVLWGPQLRRAIDGPQTERTELDQ